MKGRSLILAALLFLVAGAVLIITYKTTRTDGVVIVGGIMFIVCGLLNIFSYIADKPGQKEIEADRKAGRRTRQRSGLSNALAWVSSSAAVILGLCLLIFTSTFTSLVPFVFALLITFCSLYQFYLLAIGCRPLRLPSWLFAMPVLMLAAAIYVFIQKPGSDEGEHIIMLITGISFVVFGLTMIVESVLIGTANRKALRQESRGGAVSVPKAEPMVGSTAISEPKSLDEASNQGV